MKRDNLLIAGICGALFLVLIILLKTVDVAAIGPQGTEVGLSTLNGWAHGFFGEHDAMYKVSKYLGYLVFLTAFLMAAMGAVQLIRRRSIRRVDRRLLFLAGLYVLTMVIYVIFEFVIINYRPVIMPDNTVPEASFPSSHSMLAVVIMGSTPILLRSYIKDETVLKGLTIFCYVLMVTVVFTRLLSGVHWLTDIIGGVLIGTALVSLYAFMIQKLEDYKAQRRQKAHS